MIESTEPVAKSESGITETKAETIGEPQAGRTSAGWYTTSLGATPSPLSIPSSIASCRHRPSSRYVLAALAPVSAAVSRSAALAKATIKAERKAALVYGHSRRDILHLERGRLDLNQPGPIPSAVRLTQIVVVEGCSRFFLTLAQQPARIRRVRLRELLL